ncbi:MAG TPA: SpoIIE family protein phosphatase [Streptosporangiaceae bacterium]|nr:SpoIIE family protein phosphatase [Streptosporangiaceae bacterium]
MSASTSVPQAGRPRPNADSCDSAMLDALLAEAPVGFAFIDPDLRLRRVSSSLAEMTGGTLADQLGHALDRVWPPAVAATAESAVRSVLATGQPVLNRIAAADVIHGADDADAGPQAADGAEGAGADRISVPRPAFASDPIAVNGNGQADGAASRKLALSWYPAQDAAGATTGVTMIAIDVTANADAAEAVRRTNERYRSLVQAGNQVVWVTDPSGRVSEDSPEWRWITGQQVEEYLSEGWLAAIHADDRDRIERDWLSCIKTGAVFDGSYRVRTKTGSYRHYDVRAVPIERDGAIVEWMGASTDVTSQREADEMRGRLTEQLSAAALRTSRLQQATSLLAEALSVQEVVSVITEVGRSAIGADRSAVALVDKDRLRLRIISSDVVPAGSAGTAELTGEIPLDVPSVMTAAVTLRRPLILDSPESLRRHFEAETTAELFLRHSDERAWVGLPLTTSGTPLGALQFSFTGRRKITDEERVFLEALAGQCALALERAMLYEREHTTAETLQRSLLPDNLPDVPGIALRASYKPLSIEVGGDWYDAFRLPDGKLAVAAGDVMGKGLTAAAGMGRVRNALRALALTDPRPAAVLAGLDRLFMATELDEQVTTVCYLVVDPETGEGVAGNAGHLPPLLLGPGSTPRLDQAEAGTPLGWASPRQQYPFKLPRGHTAVLYSDGLVENRKRGLDAGLDELVAVAAQAPAGVAEDPDALIEYLVERMLAGYEQDDDVTVLVVQMPGVVPDVPEARKGSTVPEQRGSKPAPNAGAGNTGRSGRDRTRG